MILDLCNHYQPSQLRSHQTLLTYNLDLEVYLDQLLPKALRERL